MVDIRDDYFTGNFSREFFDLMTGKHLGTGSAREVFAMRKLIRDDLVIKFEYTTTKFQNAREWLVWESFKDDPEVSKWFAPCVWISPCGLILLQKRTQTIERKKLPKKVPSFLSDVKPENWGMYEGRPVIHDYGTITLSLHMDLKKAEWYEDAPG